MVGRVEEWCVGGGEGWRQRAGKLGFSVEMSGDLILQRDLVLMRVEREATLNRVRRRLGDWKPKGYAAVGNLYCVCLTEILK